MQKQLAKNMAACGFQVQVALATVWRPDAFVQLSMNEVKKQRRLRDVSNMTGEAEKTKVVHTSEADAHAGHLP